MSMAFILLITGAAAFIASFFIGGTKGSLNDELEKVSISLHQESNNLKKRVRLLEEELMVAAPAESFSEKPVHAIIINQITSLHSQGFSVPEIAKRASLSEFEVTEVLRSKGVRV